jgi:hypothetical protein
MTRTSCRNCRRGSSAPVCPGGWGGLGGMCGWSDQCSELTHNIPCSHARCIAACIAATQHTLTIPTLAHPSTHPPTQIYGSFTPPPRPPPHAPHPPSPHLSVRRICDPRVIHHEGARKALHTDDGVEIHHCQEHPEEAEDDGDDRTDT